MIKGFNVHGIQGKLKEIVYSSVDEKSESFSNILKVHKIAIKPSFCVRHRTSSIKECGRTDKKQLCKMSFCHLLKNIGKKIPPF